jgi:hypothetical protein
MTIEVQSISYGTSFSTEEVNKSGVRDNFRAELAAYDGTADDRFRKSGG